MVGPFGTFILPCGRYEVCSDITIFMELVEGEAEHVTTQKSEGKLTNKIRRDNLTIAKYLEAAEAWYFPD